MSKDLSSGYSQLKDPPQPPGIPIFGNVRKFMIGDKGCLHNAMQKIVDEYGDFVK